MKSIIHTPNSILTTVSKPVTKIDTKIKKIITHMEEALLEADNPKGVGLAAPQIGVLLRIFLLKPQETGPITVCINPCFLHKSETLVDGIPGDEKRLEGCLSVPFVWGAVKRHTWVTLAYQDYTGTTKHKKYTGFPAIIVQHEMDHLDGILFTRRVLEQKGKLYRPTIDENGKEILQPIELI